MKDGVEVVSNASEQVSATKLYEMPWFDSTDSLGAFMAAVPKDVGNLTHGAQSFGLWESMLYLDSVTYDFWMFCANEMGLGLTLGLITVTVSTKLLFSPSVLYSVSIFLQKKSSLLMAVTHGNKDATPAAGHGQGNGYDEAALAAR